MAASVVDLLEVVEVEVGEADRSAIPSGPEAFPLGHQLEGAAVHGAGERIDHGHPLLVHQRVAQGSEQGGDQHQDPQAGGGVPQRRHGELTHFDDAGEKTLRGRQPCHQHPVTPGARPGDRHDRDHVQQGHVHDRSGGPVEGGDGAHQHHPEQDRDRVGESPDQSDADDGVVCGVDRCGHVPGALFHLTSPSALVIPF